MTDNESENVELDENSLNELNNVRREADVNLVNSANSDELSNNQVEEAGTKNEESEVVYGPAERNTKSSHSQVGKKLNKAAKKLKNKEAQLQIQMEKFNKYVSLPSHIRSNEFFYGFGDMFKDFYLDYKNNKDLQRLLDLELVGFPFIGVVCSLPRLFFGEKLYDQRQGQLSFATSKEIFEVYVLMRILVLDYTNKFIERSKSQNRIEEDSQLNYKMILDGVHTSISTSVKEQSNICRFYETQLFNCHYVTNYITDIKDGKKGFKNKTTKESEELQQFVNCSSNCLDQLFVFLIQYGFKKWMNINEYLIYKLFNIISSVQVIEKLTKIYKDGLKSGKKTEKFKQAEKALSEKNKLFKFDFYGSEINSEFAIGVSTREEAILTSFPVFLGDKSLNDDFKHKLQNEINQVVALKKMLVEQEKVKQENEKRSGEKQSDEKENTTIDEPKVVLEVEASKGDTV